MKKYYYVYYSYEQWGRSYIGKRECSCLPEEDTLYFGSFADKSFNPTEKIILAIFNTVKEVFEAEKALHVFFKVDENPYFANQRIQGYHSTYTHPKGSYWINNGYENKFLKPGEEIPTGYQRGRMPNGYKTNTAYLEYKAKEVQERQKKFVEVATSPRVREKRKAKLKTINHQQGKRNSQFGTKFIHNPLTGKNTRIKKDDLLPEGWVEGARFSDKTAIREKLFLIESVDFSKDNWGEKCAEILKVSVSSAKKFVFKYSDKDYFKQKAELTPEQISSRLETISDIDLTCFGWVNKVAEKLRVSHSQARRFIDRHYLGEVYKRNSPR